MRRHGAGPRGRRCTCVFADMRMLLCVLFSLFSLSCTHQQALLICAVTPQDRRRVHATLQPSHMSSRLTLCLYLYNLCVVTAQDRRHVYEILQSAGAAVPKHVCVSRDRGASDTVRASQLFMSDKHMRGAAAHVHTNTKERVSSAVYNVQRASSRTSAYTCCAGPVTR
jgi:hypothetical protein